jgi:hypothetical protein
MTTKPRDMTGSAYCADCGVRAVHERGLGTPLVIRHEADCPNSPATAQGDQTDDDRLERDFADPLTMANVTGLRTHREHCDHGTAWGVPCWACDSEGRVRCSTCVEGES